MFMREKIVILGAGITGLSTANFLKNNKYVIIEKEKEPGGYCRTIKQNGFVWDYGGHCFHFRTSDIKHFFLSKLNAADIRFLKKKTKIFYNGLYIDYPIQKNIHQLPIEVFIDCLYDMYFRPELTKADLSNYLLSTFGKSLCNMFLFPLNKKVYKCDLSLLSHDSLGRFLPKIDVKDIITRFEKSQYESYNEYFYCPRLGAGKFIKALTQNLDKRKLFLGEHVVHIDVNKHVVMTNKNIITYDILISTIPFPALLRFTGIKFDSKLYSHSNVLVYNLGFDSADNCDYHWIYFPDEEIPFYRIGYYNNIFGQNRMSIYVEIGLKRTQKINTKKMLKKILTFLKKTRIVKNHKLLSYNILLLNPAYVHVTDKVKADVMEKKETLSKLDIYSIGRYGSWTYYSMEDCIIEAKQLVANLKI